MQRKVHLKKLINTKSKLKAVKRISLNSKLKNIKLKSKIKEKKENLKENLN